MTECFGSARPGEIGDIPGVDQRRLGVAMATTNFFRALGGATGAAVLGAVFAARAGTHGLTAAPNALGPGARAAVIDGVQTVFVVAAPIAGLALLAVLLLEEVPLRGPGGRRKPDGDHASSGPRASAVGAASTRG